jgi:TRAP transporter 4TM/12TM fusion protein
VLSFLVFGWIIVNWNTLQWRTWYVNPLSTLEVALGVLAILLVLEATRRSMGWFLPVLSLIFILYMMFGYLMPGIFTHRGAPFTMVVEHLYLVPEGIFNFLTGIVSTLLFTFLAFGAFLRISGMEKLFLDICVAIAGRRIGGPAKIAVVASCIFGMFSGSNVANVITTGSITIPLMKRVGYKPHQAGAIEAVASTGGQIMPPVMGVGIFILSEFTGVPLVRILLLSILPGLVFFGVLYMYVHVNGRKYGLVGIPGMEIPPLWATIKRGIHLTIPVFALMYFLVIGYTPFFASAVCVVMVVVVSWFQDETRMGLKKILVALEETTMAVLPLTGLMVSAAIIVGTITYTGFMIKMTSLLLEVSGQSLFILFLLVVAVAYVMGMGLPIVTSYVLIVTLAAPAMVAVGVPILCAHLAVFWLSLTSTLTPPICQAAFVAANIAKADMMRTGFESVKLGKPIFYIPFLFLYSPIVTGSVPEMLFTNFAGFLAMSALILVFEQYWMSRMSRVESVAFVGVFFLATYAAMRSLAHGWPYLLLCLAACAIIYFAQRKRMAAVPVPASPA